MIRTLCLLLLIALNVSTAVHATDALFTAGEATTAAEAPRTGDGTPAALPTALDSLLLRLNAALEKRHSEGIGALSMQVYIKGTSRTIGRTWLGRIIPNLLPFEAGHREAIVEAQCQISYCSPCNLQFTPIAYRSNSRKGRKVLREVYQVILPTYALARRRDRSDKYYVLPFTRDGLHEYTYTIRDTLLIDGRPHYKIHFHPNTKHHILLMGDVIVDPTSCEIQKLTCSGRIDFGKFSLNLDFAPHSCGHNVPDRSHITIEYDYAGNRGLNSYDCHYRLISLTPLDRAAERRNPLDLTDAYRANPLGAVDWDTLRPAPLTPYETGLYATGATTVRGQSSRPAYQELPERLMTSSNVNAFGTDLKIYGPLDPASVGYDKFNGFYFREKLRLSRQWSNGRSLIVKPEVGYNFGIEEVRYRLSTEWIYRPEIRCGLRFTTANGNSGFSSKFVDMVNHSLDSLGTDFAGLDIDYYHQYETRLEQAVELTNGLMAYVGVLYNYRTPVKRGARAISTEHLDALVHDHYADLNPYLRLTWTPRQYYHRMGRQKLYIASYYPTLSAEVAKGVSGILSSKSKYFRAELDVEQTIRLDDHRRLSYRVGGGKFFKQRGEYFVNYTYFARGQYPDSWGDHVGGVFNLLDDYWYSSSPSYFQQHVMYETPFLLLHHAKCISKYVIRERIYAATLYAEGKNAYTEFGYGIGNNYFNIGLFTGFTGLQYMDFGFRFSLEIDQHW